MKKLTPKQQRRLYDLAALSINRILASIETPYGDELGIFRDGTSQLHNKNTLMTLLNKTAMKAYALSTGYLRTQPDDDFIREMFELRIVDLEIVAADETSVSFIFNLTRRSGQPGKRTSREKFLSENTDILRPLNTWQDRSTYYGGFGGSAMFWLSRVVMLRVGALNAALDDYGLAVGISSHYDIERKRTVFTLDFEQFV